MESAKPTMAVALADERLGKGWRRSQTRIRVVAVVCALAAAAIVFGLFERFRVQPAEVKPERQLIGTIDLSIGNPVAMEERGEAKAKADIEAGLLQLRGFGHSPAKAQRLKQHYGVTWIGKAEAATPLTQAYAEGYNRAMLAEVERRQGREVLDRLLQDSGVPRPQARAGKDGP
ncbi:MAG: hypothetical protein EOP35_15535 [Rubrivivax sp.]|nr:MAG: hypothetical protein EOP35_15535 [Rubrivivax sp.]